MARPLALIAALLALGACAHQGPRPAALRRLLAPELAAQPACHRLPNGEHASLRSNGAVLEGYRAADGRLAFPDGRDSPDESIRRTYDLLAELGLFTVRDEPLGSAGGRVRRRYLTTPAAAAHYRTLVPSHGAVAWQGLCYGTRVLAALEPLGPPNRVSACETSRVASYTYRYEDIPAWADDPRVRALFPDLVTSSDAGRARQGATVIVRRGGRWYVASGDPLVRAICLSG